MVCFKRTSRLNQPLVSIRNKLATVTGPAATNRISSSSVAVSFVPERVLRRTCYVQRLGAWSSSKAFAVPYLCIVLRDPSPKRLRDAPTAYDGPTPTRSSHVPRATLHQNVPTVPACPIKVSPFLSSLLVHSSLVFAGSESSFLKV